MALALKLSWLKAGGKITPICIFGPGLFCVSHNDGTMPLQKITKSTRELNKFSRLRKSNVSAPLGLEFIIRMVNAFTFSSSSSTNKFISPKRNFACSLYSSYDIAYVFNFMALQVTGLASQISENFGRNAGTGTSPGAEIRPPFTGLGHQAFNLSFRGPPTMVLLPRSHQPARTSLNFLSIWLEPSGFADGYKTYPQPQQFVWTAAHWRDRILQ